MANQSTQKIVYRLTGERRKPKKGEYYLTGDGEIMLAILDDYKGTYQIVIREQ